MNLLHIDSSITGANSVSRQLTAETVKAWCAEHPATQVEYLDLALHTPPHLNMDALGFRTGQQATTEAELAQKAISDALVSQFLATDIFVIGAPFYNFTIPTQLKSWIDRVLQVGRTFRYTANGPEGLAGGKTAIVVMSRGGIYSATEAGRSKEHQEGYLRTVFDFVGISDVRFVLAEGLAKGPDSRAEAIEAARANIARAVAEQTKEPLPA